MIVKDDEIIKVETKYDTPILTINVPVIKLCEPTYLSRYLPLELSFETSNDWHVAVYQLEHSEELLEGVKIRHYRLLAK